MTKMHTFIIALVTVLMICGCSRKSHPSSKTEESSTATVKTAPAKTKTAVPKVIVVNDNVAKKSIDGRYYYDLMGHRYWKNYKDGKYYLFHQSMFSDPAFKPKIE